jgi:hypothetical protein
MVGAKAVRSWDEAWKLACKILGKSKPSVMVTPNVSQRVALLWRVGAKGGGRTQTAAASAAL